MAYTKEEAQEKLLKVYGEHQCRYSDYNRGIRFAIAYAQSIISEIKDETMGEE